jgi:hypothetical protein
MEVVDGGDISEDADNLDNDGTTGKRDLRKKNMGRWRREKKLYVIIRVYQDVLTSL